MHFLHSQNISTLETLKISACVVNYNTVFGFLELIVMYTKKVVTNLNNSFSLRTYFSFTLFLLAQ